MAGDAAVDAARERTSRPLFVVLALGMWGVAGYLGWQGAVGLQRSARMPQAAISFALLSPTGSDSKAFVNPLFARLADVGPLHLDRAEQGMIVLRVQTSSPSLTRSLLTSLNKERMKTDGLTPEEKAQATALVAAHPLPGMLDLVSEKSAPLLDDPAVRRKHATGRLLLAGAAAILGLVLLSRR